MLKIFFIVISAFLFSCADPVYKIPHVLIHTSFGNIEVELYPNKSPKTVAAFLLAVETNLYDNTTFYRVLKAEDLPTDFNTGIVQGGLWQTQPAKQKNIKGIDHESTKKSGLSHTDGIISMARTDTGTATTEFFICIGDQSPLDHGRRGTQDGQGYAAFGKVIKGMTIVRSIQAQKSRGENFEKKIEIKKIEKM